LPAHPENELDMVVKRLRLETLQRLAGKGDAGKAVAAALYLADGDIALGQFISDPFDAVLRQNGGHGDSN
jgi:hypothetical protein